MLLNSGMLAAFLTSEVTLAICSYAMARLAEPREPDAPVRCLEAESAGGGGWEPGRWYWCLLVALVTIKSLDGQDGEECEKRRLIENNFKYSNSSTKQLPLGLYN